MSWLETSANIFTVICIYLAGRRNIHTWWTGIVACILFGLLFFESKLYADVTLQAFFIVTGVIGWLAWHKNRGKEVVQVAITKLTSTQAIVYFHVAAVSAVLYGFVLHSFTDAWAPYMDSVVLTFSILGQLLLMYRKREAWPVWVLVNILSVPLYASRELYMTATLYAVFLVHAVWVTPQWYKACKE